MHCPSPEHLFGQLVSSPTVTVLQSAPAYPAWQWHAPPQHTPCPLQSPSPGHALAMEQSFPAYPGSHRHWPSGDPSASVMPYAHTPWPAQPPSSPPPQPFSRSRDWMSASLVSQVRPANPVSQKQRPFAHMPRLLQSSSHLAESEQSSPSHPGRQ